MFFVYTVQELTRKVLEGKVVIEHGDIRLHPDREDGFVFSDRLWSNQDFVSAWNSSDLPHIVKRMAQFAGKRFKRLETHRDKTEAKMYHTPNKARRTT